VTSRTPVGATDRSEHSTPYCPDSVATSVAMIAPIAIPAEGVTRRNHCAVQVDTARRSAPRRPPIASRAPVRPARHQPCVNAEMSGWETAFRAAEKRHQLIARFNARTARAGVTWLAKRRPSQALRCPTDGCAGPRSTKSGRNSETLKRKGLSLIRIPIRPHRDQASCCSLGRPRGPAQLPPPARRYSWRNTSRRSSKRCA
jgi:hypothetical protein